ncbi:MAG: ABC transporter permease [Marinoscillum sp.]
MRLPGYIERLIKFLFHQEVSEEISGDLLEEMEDYQSRNSRFSTHLHLIKTTLLFLRFRYTWHQFNLKNANYMQFNTSLKSAWRNLKKDKSSLTLNAIGLTIGFILSMVIFLVLHRELTFDQWHSKSDRIFRVTHDETISAKSTRHLATVGPPVGPALKQDYSEIENFVRFRYTPTQPVRHDNTSFYENRIFYIDSTLFSVFDYPLAQGNEKSALVDPNSVVITQDIAFKYFGKDDPLGKRLEISGESYTVSGVFAPTPSNTHFDFDIVMPFHAFEVPFGYPVTLNDWGWISFHTYVLLKEDVNATIMEAQLVDFIKTHWPEDRWDAFRFRMQPLADIYLGEVKNDILASGNWTNIYAFGIAGALLLALIIFNYTNLSVARSLTRTKEVGVRKSMGAAKGSIFMQFSFESMILAICCLLISTLLLFPTINFLQQSLGITLNLPTWQEGLKTLLPFAIPFALIIGFVAGLYPGLVMMKVRAVQALTRNLSGGSMSMSVRKVLVTMQFVITIALLSGSIIIYKQIRYMQEKDLGFDQSTLAVLRVPGPTLLEEYDVLKNQLLEIPNVERVSVGGGRMDGDNGSVPVKTPDMEESLPMFVEAVDYGFYKTLGIEMAAGREFSKSFSADSAGAVIVNETAVKTMGYTTNEEALGKEIQVSDIRSGKIIGVVSDYHFTSLHHKIGPLAIVYPRTYLEDVYLKIQPGNLMSMVNSIEAKWQALFPELPFDLIFLENHLNQLYQSDVAFAKLFRLFTIVTILIACLGLYGLISLITTQKIKEISMRKVLGATLQNLISSLFKPFAIYIGIALVLVSPIAYYLLSQWLSNYAYKIDLGWIWFLLAGLVVMVTAFIATLSHLSRIARINPARTLRSD